MAWRWKPQAEATVHFRGHELRVQNHVIVGVAFSERDEAAARLLPDYFEWVPGDGSNDAPPPGPAEQAAEVPTEEPAEGLEQ